jgi:hypothetical protein
MLDFNEQPSIIKGVTVVKPKEEEEVKEEVKEPPPKQTEAPIETKETPVEPSPELLQLLTSMGFP